MADNLENGTDNDAMSSERDDCAGISREHVIEKCLDSR